MNKLLLLIILVFSFYKASSQDTMVISGEEVSFDDIKKERKRQKIEERDLFIKKYVDSLNSYNSNDCKLPEFFKMNKFDQKLTGQFLIGSHANISLRKLIIDQIDNYTILWCVKNSNDFKIKKKNPIRTSI